MEVQHLNIDEIHQTVNSRHTIKQHEFEALMLSIKNEGLLQPIGVRKMDGKWIVNYGNRRFMACKKLGWATVPSVILDETQKERDFFIYNLVENEHRSDTTDIECGKVYYELINNPEYNMTASEIAIKVGVSLAKVKQRIKMFKGLPEEVHGLVAPSGRNGMSTKAGKVPLTLAEHIVNTGKKLNLKKSQIKDAMEYARQDGVNKTKLTKALDLMGSGATTKKALEAASKVRTVNLRVPVLEEDYEFYKNKYKTSSELNKAICQVLYGVGDEDGIVFQKPY